MGVVIAYSLGGTDVTEVMEDAVVRTVEFEEEDVEGELPNNSKAPIPAATATAPAPAYFRKRRLDGFRLDLLDSTMAALLPVCTCCLAIALNRLNVPKVREGR
jgi:hypothetical protein